MIGCEEDGMVNNVSFFTRTIFGAGIPAGRAASQRADIKYFSMRNLPLQGWHSS